MFCWKLGLVGPVQQKIKLSSAYLVSKMSSVTTSRLGNIHSPRNMQFSLATRRHCVPQRWYFISQRGGSIILYRAAYDKYSEESIVAPRHISLVNFLKKKYAQRCIIILTPNVIIVLIQVITNQDKLKYVRTSLKN